MRRALSAIIVIASGLIVGLTPAWSAPFEIDKKTDEFIENLTKDPPAQETDSTPSGPAYRDSAPRRGQGPLIPSDLKQDRQPQVQQQTFKERFKDLAAYEAEVLRILKQQYPGQFEPSSDSTRYAKIVIRSEFESEHDPKVAADNVKKYVDRAMSERRAAAEERKKASQRAAKRVTTPLQEAVADPQVARGNSIDYGEVASTLLAIGGAVAPVIGRSSVPVARPSVRAPTPTAPPRPIRSPTTSSTITGTR